MAAGKLLSHPATNQHGGRAIRTCTIEERFTGLAAVAFEEAAIEAGRSLRNVRANLTVEDGGSRRKDSISLLSRSSISVSVLDARATSIHSRSRMVPP